MGNPRARDHEIRLQENHGNLEERRSNKCKVAELNVVYTNADGLDKT